MAATQETAARKFSRHGTSGPAAKRYSDRGEIQVFDHYTEAAKRFRAFPHSLNPVPPPRVHHEMATNSPKTKGRDRALLTLEALSRVLDTTKNACSIPPAKIAFASVSTLLAVIRVRALPSSHDRLSILVHLGQNGQQE